MNEAKEQAMREVREESVAQVYSRTSVSNPRRVRV